MRKKLILCLLLSAFAVPAPAKSKEQEIKAPVPPLRPAVEKPKVSTKKPPKAEQPARSKAAPSAGEARQLQNCEAELQRLGARFKRTKPIYDGKNCGVAAPYNLISVGKGIAVTPATNMRCETALALTRWIQQTVLPATKAFGPKVQLKKIRQAATYVCRSRNNIKGAKISEHARGAAIDIAGFDFEGHAPFSIQPRHRTGKMEEAFQRAIRGGSCLYFTTVLGPGSDAHHDNHLHLDLAVRRGNWRLCQ